MTTPATTDCETWGRLTDRQAIGEVLSPSESTLLRAHEATCAACADEAVAFRGLSAGVLEAVPSEEQVEEIIRAAQLEPDSERSFALRSPVRRIAAVAGFIVAAAALALIFVRTRDAARGPAATHMLPTSTTEVVAKAPPAVSAPIEASASASDLWLAESGTSCRVVLGDVTVCLEPNAQARTEQLGASSGTLELVRGRAVASLAPRPRERSFGIATRAGSVTAVGTIFTVEVTTTGETIARVLRGEVAVKSAGARDEQRLRAGQSVRVGSPSSVAPLEPEDRQRDLALLPEERGAGPHTTADAAVPRAPSESLLSRARSLRARGESAQAAELYRSIHAASPQSSTGRAALLALAELRLSDLGDPAGALKAFNSYLTGNRGPLAREAEYGRIRALRALGRKGEEGAAIDRFIQAYPNGPEAQALRQRLRALRDR